MNGSERDIYQRVAEGALSVADARRQLAKLAAKAAPAAPTRRFPLSEGQRVLWTLQRLTPEGAAYNLPMAVELDPAVDAAALERALAATFSRHPMLGAAFETGAEGPFQTIGATAAPRLERTDLGDADEEALFEALEREARRPFRLDKEPPTRARLWLRRGQAPILSLTMHHIVFDGVSTAVYLRDLETAYAAARAGREPAWPAPAAAYSEFTAWQRDMLAGEEGRRARAFWATQLAGAPHRLELPVDRPRPSRPSYRGASVSASLDAAAVRDLCQRLKTSTFALTLTVFAVQLYRYSRQEDMVIGTPASGRPRTRFEETVGYFANMVALRARPRAATRFSELAAQIGETVAAALEYGDCPLSTAVEAAARAERRAAVQPFQAAFYFENFWPKPAAGEPLLRRHIKRIHQEGEFDLIFNVIDQGGELRLDVRYSRDLFLPETAEAMARHYSALLARAAAAPDTTLDALSPLGDDERRDVLAGWNQTEAEYPRERTATALIAAQAARRPDAPAVSGAGETLSYGELVRRAGLLAGRLNQLGVGRGARVGVAPGRRPDLLVALLGVWQSGAAYVPLDPMYPSERLAYMLDDSGAAALVIHDELAHRLPSREAPTIRLTGDWPEIERAGAAPSQSVTAEDPAYVIYTSGSTGKPKGVQVSGRALVNFLWSMAREPGFGPDDKLLALTTVCFDIAGLELYLPLVAGGQVEIAPEEATRNGLQLARLLTQSEATVVQATPASWRMLLAAAWRPARPIKALCGGEALPRALADALLDLGLELWNMYGPTETTIWSSVARVTRDELVVIGRPIANTQLWVLDEAQEPVAVGETGELFIGGDGLADGYYGKPELTRERFAANPLDVGTPRFYRTGDLARRRADGQVICLGRADGQVKLRGYRIELGEIEARLTAMDYVRASAVALRRDAGGEPLLAAFLVLARRFDPAVDEPPAKALARSLPEYMIPGQYTALHQFPMTYNRKIDRKALAETSLELLLAECGEPTQPFATDAGPAAPEPTPPQPAAAEPGDDALARLVARDLRRLAALVAGVDPAALTPTARLSAHGYNSLRYTELSVKINQFFQIDSDPTLFFEADTVREAAAALADRHGPALRVRYEDALRAEARRPPPAAAAPLPTAARAAQPARRAESDPIAIVGMAGAFPGAPDLDAFWRLLESGQSAIGEIPAARWDWRAFSGETDDQRARWGAFLDEVDRFDCLFFGISPREAERMDPQQRLFLECAWRALEDAGERPSALAGSKLGVFAGVSASDYGDLIRMASAEIEADALTSMSHAVLANRISNFLDVHGPSEPVNAACASALVAVHRAVKAIHDGECEAAIAGGVNLVLHPGGHLALAKAGLLSAAGACRPFDQDADGYVRGEGVGALLLKPLSRARADGNPIHAVILATGVNHGGRANSLTAPNPKAQADLLAEVYGRAAIDPDTVGYIEASANGTALGDPLELNALKQAFARLYRERGHTPPAEPRRLVGTVKPYVGHLEAASGMAALFKTILSMRHGAIPANIGLRQPNAYIRLEGGSFELAREARAWPRAGDAPRRAGVSSFGIGGVNVHIALEEYRDPRPRTTAAFEDEPRIAPISARDEATLSQVVDSLLAFLEDNAKREPSRRASLEEIAFTLQAGREAMDERLTLIVHDELELVDKLTQYRAGVRHIDGVYRESAHAHKSVAAMLLDGAEGETFIQAVAQNRAYDKLAQLWSCGVAVDWRLLYADGLPRHAPLPGYPFAKRRCWIGDDADAPLFAGAAAAAPAAAPEPRPAPPPKPAAAATSLEATLRALIAEALKLEPGELPLDADLIDYGFDSFTGMKTLTVLRERLGFEIAPQDLFARASVRGLARFLEQQPPAPVAAEPVPSAATEPATPTAETSMPPAADEPNAPVPTEPKSPAAVEVEESAGPFPVSVAQRALWFIQQLDPDSFAYHLPSAFPVRDYDTAAIERAFDVVIARNPSLRTVFALEGEEPVQVVQPTAGDYFAEEDLAGMDPAAAITHMRDVAFQPFDLERGPLLRVRLFHRGDGEGALLICIHHIVFDGSSFAILNNEFRQALDGLASGRQPDRRPKPASYADFARWQRDMLSGPEGDAHWAYWREKLAGDLPVLSLPADRSRVAGEAYDGASLAVAVDGETAAALARLARARRVTPFTAMLAAFKILLARYTGQKDIIVGSPYAGRSQSRFETTIGYFINMVPMRDSLADNPTLIDFLARVQDTVFDGVDHGDFPFAELAERLGLDHGGEAPPLFQTVFILQNWIQDMDTGGVDQLPLDEIHETGAFDLTLEVIVLGDQTTAYFKYDPRLFDRERIARMANHYQRLLASMAAAPDQRVHNLDILPADERRQVLADFNRREADAPISDRTIAQRFEAMAAAQAEATAVEAGRERLSYAELNARANRAAACLRARGVGPDTLVGVCLDRSLELAVAMLATLKAGGAYTPLDPAYPRNRVAAIIEDARLPLIITRRKLMGKLSLPRGRVFLLDAEAAALARQSPEDPAPAAGPESLAYVVYTSGSTGKPKGTMIAHRALVNYVDGFIRHYRLTPADRVLQFASINFDTAAEELYPTWLSGAALVFRNDEAAHSIDAFLDLVDEAAITVLDLPTAFWHTWVSTMDELDLRFPESVRLVIVGGEEAKSDRLAVWQRRVGDRALWSNTYGPTEATIAASLFEPEFAGA